MTGLDQFLSGEKDAFGGPPPANGNCRAPGLLSTIIGSFFALAVVVGIGVVVISIHRPVSVMPAIAAEAPGRTEASCPTASTGPVENAPLRSTVAPVKEAAARAQLTAWWAAAHVRRHAAHPQPPIWRTPRFPELSQIRASAPRDFGCPPSLGAACGR